jgi:hypothetical protein
MSICAVGTANGTAAHQQLGKKRKPQREAVAVNVKPDPEQPAQSKKKKRRSTTDAAAAGAAPDGQPYQEPEKQQMPGAYADAVVKGNTRDKGAAKAAKRTGKKLSAW